MVKMLFYTNLHLIWGLRDVQDRALLCILLWNEMYDKIGWGDGRRLWGLAIDPWCEEVKVVVFRKHPCGSLLHKIAVLGGGILWVEHSSYITNEGDSTPWK